MEHKIQFTIGSIFKGEAFKQAMSATKTMTSAVKRAAGSVGAIAGAFGSLDQKSARAMSAVAGLMSALSTGNPIVIASTAAITGLSWWIKDLEQQTQRATERANQLKEAANFAFDTQLNTTMKSTLDEIKTIGDEFDRITAAAKSFQDALNGLNASYNRRDIIQLETAKLQAMIDAAELGTEAIVGAEYDVQIARMKQAQAIEEATNKEKAIQAEIEATQAKMQIGYDSIQKLQDKKVLLEKSMEMLGETDIASRRKLLASIEKLDTQIYNANLQISKDNDKLSELNAKKEAAIQDTINAEKQGNLDALKAEKKLNEARNEHAKAIEEAKDQQEKANKEERIKALELAKKHLTDELNEAAKQAQAMADAISNMLGIQLGFGGTFVGQNGTDWAKNAGALGAADMQSVGSAGAKGATDSKSAHQAQMAAERAYRDGQSSALTNQFKREDREIERLQERSWKSLSQADKQKLMDLLNQKKNRDKLREDAENGIDALNADDAIPNKIQELKEAIENLTLK